MHDRRIDGTAHTFGNFGALYKNAMTWFDHETLSLWSQPVGTALMGPHEGVRLSLIPAAVMPWNTWRKEQPHTEVLDAPRVAAANPFSGARGQYVLGVSLGDVAKSFPFEAVGRKVAVNDFVGDVPVVVYANPEDGSAHIFIRRTESGTLDFEWRNGELRDLDTGSLWDPARGFAVDGELRGQILKEVPYSTAYGWAWSDFYPDSEVYGTPDPRD